jgi:hypothetical protein
VALKSAIPNNISVEYQRVSRERRENGTDCQYLLEQMNYP